MEGGRGGVGGLGREEGREGGGRGEERGSGGLQREEGRGECASLMDVHVTVRAH